MKKSVFLVIVLCVALLASVLVINTLRFTSRQMQVAPIQAVSVDENSVAQHLAQALRFQTISHQEAGNTNGDEFVALHQYLEHTFPKVHSTLTKELVGGYSLLYTWKGRDETLRPILLMGHQDVVPVEVESLAKWEQPPFEGHITGGYIWGRGAMDDKNAVLGIMSAAELLLGQGFQPERTVYFAFGQDEEVGGGAGAVKIADLLRQRHIELEYVLDEGLAITHGIVPGITTPVALIGIAEKGYVSLELSVGVEGGHSSAPPPQTAIGILSTAVTRLEEHRMPARIDGVTRQLLETVGPEMPFGTRLVMANLWFFKSLVERRLSETPSGNSAIRTTTATTMIEAGLKENVLPSRARAVVNFRILPGDSIERVIAHVSETIHDPRITVNRFGIVSGEPSTVSTIDAAGFQMIQRTIRQLFPDVLVAPALVTGATDSRHYATLTNSIYRFSPMRVGPEDIERVHGINERIAVTDYAGGVKFYYQLIKSSSPHYS